MMAKIAYMMNQLYKGNQFLFWLILPTVIISWVAYEQAKEKNYNTNIVLIVLSAFSPILGLLCYIARQNADKDSANVYLGCAVASFVVWFLIFMLA